MKTSRRVLYTGRVQGVGFRYIVKQIATGFDVTGWVRNLLDGTVEMQVAGESTEVGAFVSAIASSQLAGYIKETRESDLGNEEPTAAGFEIRH